MLAVLRGNRTITNLAPSIIQALELIQSSTTANLALKLMIYQVLSVTESAILKESKL
jgi:hypothetical protein